MSAICSRVFLQFFWLCNSIFRLCNCIRRNGSKLQATNNHDSSTRPAEVHTHTSIVMSSRVFSCLLVSSNDSSHFSQQSETISRDLQSHVYETSKVGQAPPNSFNSVSLPAMKYMKSWFKIILLHYSKCSHPNFWCMLKIMEVAVDEQYISIFHSSCSCVTSSKLHQTCGLRCTEQSQSSPGFSTAANSRTAKLNAEARALPHTPGSCASGIFPVKWKEHERTLESSAFCGLCTILYHFVPFCTIVFRRKTDPISAAVGHGQPWTAAHLAPVVSASTCPQAFNHCAPINCATCWAAAAIFKPYQSSLGLAMTTWVSHAMCSLNLGSFCNLREHSRAHKGKHTYRILSPPIPGLGFTCWKPVGRNPRLLQLPLFATLSKCPDQKYPRNTETDLYCQVSMLPATWPCPRPVETTTPVRQEVNETQKCKMQQTSMDWFKGKSTQNHGFEMILASNIEVSCKFSHHPILGIHLINKVAHLLQLVVQITILRKGLILCPGEKLIFTSKWNTANVG